MWRLTATWCVFYGRSWGLQNWSVFVHEMEGSDQTWDHLPLSPLRLLKGKESNKELEDSYQAIATTPFDAAALDSATLCWLHLHPLCSALTVFSSPNHPTPDFPLSLSSLVQATVLGAGNPRWGYQPIQVWWRGCRWLISHHVCTWSFFYVCTSLASVCLIFFFL